MRLFYLILLDAPILSNITIHISDTPFLWKPVLSTKDLRKSSKLEGILERKLEKLEHKTKKIKERKLALLTKSSDSDAGPSTSRRDTYHCIENEEDLLLMDAAPVNRTGTFPRMLGGEVYLHKWEVMNTGKLPWTSKTSLMFTWGSKALKPLDTIISVPYLRPGDTGTLAVRLQIPNHPGLYECYWHFHHKERRFGHWLGCQIIVDPFDLKGTNSVLETSFAEYICNAKKFKTNDTDVEDDVEEAVTQYSEILQEPGTSNSQTYTFNIEQKYTNEDEKSEEIKDEESSAKNVLDTLVRDISTRVEDMKLHEPTDTNCSSDSDNQSIVSLTESCSSKSLPEEFVVVPIPDCFKVDVVPDLPIEDIQQEQNIKENEDIVTDILTGKSKQATEGNFKLNAEEVPDNFDDNNNTEETDQNVSVSRSSSKVGDNHSNDGSQKSDIVIISLSNEKDDENTGYAYVIIDGHRLQIPKKILKSEYLITAEGTPSPKDNMTRSSSVASSVEIVDKEEVPQLEAVNSDAQTVTQIPPGEQQTKDSTESNSNIQSDGLLSHCSAEGSTFSDVNSAVEKNSRLFIFPQSRPGYEVFYPVADAPENSAQGELQWMYCDMENVNSENTVLSHPEFHNYPVAPLQPTIANSPPLNLSTHDRNPFITGNTVHVPNYQQTPPSMRTPPESTVMFTNLADRASTPTSSLGLESHLSEPVRISESSSPIHILPETLVAGAVNVASSAINTARSVINMIVPREQPGRWVNGHWVSTNPATPREGNLQALAEMGFWNRDLNATLLARYNDDLSRVVAELVQ
ncbi:hypothetical protein NQ314_013735 [Rhamnusium bicolor]|uniref:Nbr1 FW domain-containing protein n=1 Tax=Rhamnusium bicolor TaxID=1586634 RepID=A0AAV8X7F6_9CUCU|nr:hypothetical protein NQ314_013735 [Rhamnusium bicolor]